MVNLSKELGVQSYCFRGFKDNEQVAQLVKKCGLSALELCGVHIDFQDVSQFEPVIETYKRNGIKIVAIGVQGFANDKKKEEKYFEFCKLAGCKLMSVSFNLSTTPKCYRTAERLADKYDVYLGIHNHGARHWLGSAEMLRYVFANTSKRIGLHIDTAWALDSREDPVAMCEMFADRLYGLHIKDFVFDRAGRPEDVIVGSGNLDLKKLIATLKKIDFKGAAVLEYEGDVENPVPAITKCVKAVRKLA